VHSVRIKLGILARLLRQRKDAPFSRENNRDQRRRVPQESKKRQFLVFVDAGMAYLNVEDPTATYLAALFKNDDIESEEDAILGRSNAARCGASTRCPCLGRFC
jgi:hypothetical protein